MKIIVTIVDAKKRMQVEKFYQDEKIVSKVTFLAAGTAPSEIYDLLGFGQIDKEVILGLVEADNAATVLQRLGENLDLDQRGAGVAFTIPVSSIGKKSLAFLTANLEEINEH